MTNVIQFQTRYEKAVHKLKDLAIEKIGLYLDSGDVNHLHRAKEDICLIEQLDMERRIGVKSRLKAIEDAVLG